MGRSKYVYKRKDKRWEARVKLSVGADGKIKYKYLYARTCQEVLEKKSRFEEKQEAERARREAEKAAFTRVSELWLEEYQEEWKPSTFVKYKGFVDRYISPEWSGLSLDKLTQEKFDGLLERLSKSLSAGVLNLIGRIVLRIVDFAVEKQILPSALPLKSRFYKKKPAVDVEPLTVRESAQLMSYAQTKDNPVSLGVQIALYSGLRIGELCGLRWSDVDLQENTLHVRRTLQRMKNVRAKDGEAKTHLVFGSPKNGRERRIPLHSGLRRLLHPEGHDPDSYVITGSSEPMEPRRLSRLFRKLLKAAGVSQIRFHGLRHTFASRCIESGMDVKALSEILGHSSVKITMDRYVHLSARYKQEQIEKLEVGQFFGQCSGKTA